ncbi:hypothetical protein [Corynebacterium oculi]|uniref:Uncharacterized protein n=1 Tax=Corynebacterium oculi TaxID=1544416 RepID=A0A0Q0U0V0_9CORY|nr:hypothetical protein [Corynebacterium oculi]KQB85315.1 hypothetical protein Cocul_00454 [Corynebacterium oculi]
MVYPLSPRSEISYARIQTNIADRIDVEVPDKYYYMVGRTPPRLLPKPRKLWGFIPLPQKKTPKHQTRRV